MGITFVQGIGIGKSLWIVFDDIDRTPLTARRNGRSHAADSNIGE